MPGLLNESCSCARLGYAACHERASLGGRSIRYAAGLPIPLPIVER